MSSGTVEQIANAILYEGYLLYPYRASALKNQRRWNFGVVYPRAADRSGEHGGVDPWSMQTECLCQAGPLSAIEIKVRFLRLAEQTNLDTASYFQDAEDTEIVLPTRRLVELKVNSVIREFSFPGRLEQQGPINRRRLRLEGVVTAHAAETEEGPWKITVRIENRTRGASNCPSSSGPDEILLQSLVSTHTILRLWDGDFVSMIDPPEELRQVAGSCANLGTWPVLVADEGKRDTVLSSPIILYDYPQIAPESPGDLFDGTEIDEILTLRILTMTDQEKEEVRRTDPRARQLLERTETLPAEDFMRLHGVLRSAVTLEAGNS
jgi:hypothetical protein